MEPGGLFAEYNENPIDGRRGKLQQFDGSFIIPLPASCHSYAYSLRFKYCKIDKTCSVRLLNERGMDILLGDGDLGYDVAIYEDSEKICYIHTNLRDVVEELIDELVSYID